MILRKPFLKTGTIFWEYREKNHFKRAVDKFCTEWSYDGGNNHRK